ncbi:MULTISPECIES: translocation/assembly module TamB domain-containing protein [Cobetia]|uniref:autotransporter assembly complex protein TamB n=1 Tax=Cobetia TaxID=204286 RepID=UPI001582CE9B|nr:MULTISPECIES: translocation/assembly module TamB domain-containing protein [Cobetia]MDI4661131.1 translocation/assembly module TamB [Cobetia sp. BMC6]NUJ55550.1 translocation/assembly module TamB [Cobetia marina]
MLELSNPYVRRGGLVIRLLIWLLVFLIGLTMLLVGGVLSPWGTGLVLDQARSRGFIDYSQASGSPLEALSLKDVSLDLPGLTVNADSLSLAWGEDCLLKGKLCLESLESSGLAITLSDSGASTEPEAESSESLNVPIVVPIPIEVHKVAIDDFALALADGSRVTFDHFHTSATLSVSTLTLGETRLITSRFIPADAAAAQTASDSVSLEGVSITSEAQQAASAVINAQDVASQAESAAKAITDEAAEVSGKTAAETTDQTTQAGRIALPEVYVPLTIEVPDLAIEDFALEGPSPYEVSRLSLALKTEGHDITLSRLEVDSRDVNADLVAQVTLKDEYPLSATLNAETLIDPVRNEKLRLSLEGSLADLEASLKADGPLAAELVASADVLDSDLPFEARLSSERITWPFAAVSDDTSADAQKGAQTATQANAGKNKTASAGATSFTPDYSVENLALVAKGSLSGYTTTLDAIIEGRDIPRATLSLAGDGDLEHYRWQPLQIALKRGTATTRGEIHWQEGIEVAAELALDKLHPEDLLPAPTGGGQKAVRGELSGNLVASFNQPQQGPWAIDVSKLDIHGTLLERPLTLTGKLAGNADMQWNVDALELRQGQNRLSANGKIAKTITLAANIDFPALSTLMPDIAGELKGKIDASGTLDKPQLASNFTARRLQIGENRISDMALSAEVDARKRGIDDPALDIALNADDVRAGGQQIATVALTLGGFLSDHTLQFDTEMAGEMPLSRLGLTLKGGLDKAREHYRGALSPLTANTDFGDFNFDTPASFDANLAKGSVLVQPFCLSREQGGQICVAEPLSAGNDGQAVVTLEGIPLDMAQSAMPESWSIGGATGGKITASWKQGGQRWNADAELAGKLTLAGEDADGNAWSLPETTLQLALEATPDKADLDTQIRLDSAGGIGLTVSVLDPAGAGQLDGSLAIRDIDLSPYRPLVAGMTQLEGKLAGDVEVGGNLNLPSLTGPIALTGVKVQGDGLPVSLSDAQFTVDFDGNSADIDGYLVGNDARWGIDGEAAWPTLEDWTASLNLDGAKNPLELHIAGIGRMRVAPDLAINASPTLLKLRGDVKVPWTRIEVDQVPPSAVSPSSDTVIIERPSDQDTSNPAELADGSDTAKALNEAGMALDVRIGIHIGPDARLEAMGLKTKLRGDLDVRQSKGGVQVFGEVNLVDGTYKSFGQDLQISKGQVLLAGPPSSPRLNIEAIRDPDNTEDDVTAGVRVTGLASSPSVEIFSDPSMDESSALSYLLRGEGLDSDTSSDSAVTSALIGMSLAQSGQVVGQIGETFGVRDLSLDSSGSGDDSQVVVSGYIAPDLKLSYGVGLFSPIAELTLRYKLFRNLYAEAVSGTAQAVDLLYSFSLGRSELAPRVGKDR